MSTEFKVVQWNSAKKRYDLAVAGGVLTTIAAFVLTGLIAFPAPGEISPPVVLMRALGATAVLMLHVILAIGPAARLTSLAYPLLYNRRHLGVMFFLVCLLHALIAVGFYGGFGPGIWLTNVVTAGRASLGIPFELFGFLALLVFFAMAATSHDFWLSALSPKWWKSLHMLVYLAYASVVAHVMLGAAQERAVSVWPILLLAGVGGLTVLHIAAGFRSQSPKAGKSEDGWTDAGTIDEIADGRARVVTLPSGDSVAVFRSNNELSAIRNVCAHQGGPLGEGKVVDGCITCPWHGYQYRTADGCSPPPYTERLSTYDVRVHGENVFVRSEPNKLGTPASTHQITGPADAEDE